MSIRTLLLLLVALVISGGTAYFAKTYLDGLQNQAQVAQPAQPSEPTVRVLVANREMIAGTFLSGDNVIWKDWPEGSLGEEMLTEQDITMDDVEGSVTRVALAKGQPLLRRQVVEPGDRGFLAAVLTPGMRAISVPLKDFTGVSGFIFPGDTVDLIARFRIKSYSEDGSDGPPRYTAVTVLRGVRVVAMDQKTESVKGEAKVAETATLEVTTKEAEKVALVMEWGTFSLALNSLSDPEAVAERAQDWWYKRRNERNTSTGPDDGPAPFQGLPPNLFPNPSAPDGATTAASSGAPGLTRGTVEPVDIMDSRDIRPSQGVVQVGNRAFSPYLPFQSPNMTSTRAPLGAAPFGPTPVPSGSLPSGASDRSAVDQAAIGGGSGTSFNNNVREANAGIMDLSVVHDVDRNYTMDWELFTVDGVDMIKVQDYVYRNSGTRRRPPIILHGNRVGPAYFY